MGILEVSGKCSIPIDKVSGDKLSEAILDLEGRMSSFGFGTVRKNKDSVSFRKMVGRYQQPGRFRFEGVGILKEIHCFLEEGNESTLTITYRAKLDMLLFLSFLAGLMVGLSLYVITLQNIGFIYGLLIGLVLYMLGRLYILDKVDGILSPL